MSSNVLAFTKFYIYREDTLSPISSKGAAFFSVSYGLQIRIEHHHVKTTYGLRNCLFLNVCVEM